MQTADESRCWQVLSKRVLHTSQFGIDVTLWTVRLPDGTVVKDHPVLDHHRPAVAVIPVGADGRILMIDHYRVITNRRGWELPAGRVDRGESVDEAARRESARRRVIPRSHGPRWGRTIRPMARTGPSVGPHGSERDTGAPLVQRAGDPPAGPC